MIRPAQAVSLLLATSVCAFLASDCNMASDAATHGSSSSEGSGVGESAPAPRAPATTPTAHNPDI